MPPPGAPGRGHPRPIPCGRHGPEDERDPMSEKLELRNFVGGEHADTADGHRMDLVDPSTGEVFASAPVSGAEDVDRAYTTAATAFETWRDTTPSERQKAL